MARQFSRYQNLNPYTNTSNVFFLRYNKYKIMVEKKNTIIVIIGPVGTGKSYSAVSYAELIQMIGLGGNFSVDRIHFDVLSFLGQIKAKDKDGKFVLKAGDCIILDEAGVNISSRDWYSETNKKLLNVLETFRWRGLITILTVPDISFIDSKARRLITFLFEMQHILKKQQIAIVKPLIVSINQRKGDIYYIYYQYRNPSDGIRYKITNLFLPMPSKELRLEYDKKKEAFATNLAEKMYRDIEWSSIKKDFNSQQKKILAIIQQEGDIGYKRVAEILATPEKGVYSNLKYIYFILGKKYDEVAPS